MILIVAVLIDTVARVASDPLRVVLQIVLLGVLGAMGWLFLTRTHGTRLVAAAVAALALVAVAASFIGAGGIIALVTRVSGVVLALGLARYALGSTLQSLKRSETRGSPVPPAARAVLFMNLKSGGGKAERSHLVDECRRRGIEPVVLEAGEDWLQRVRDVASSGVDVLGMAGGDGSQAMVGTVAAEMDLPMVVVPAGTRNHLALDLGLDRDDVVGALDAYGDALERTLDLADVNGHVFVNNVSLGIYAAIVRSPEYRDAKVDTTLSTLPKILGRAAEPFDLRFTDPDGNEHRGAHIIQISNNPYGGTAGGLGSRPRLDTGRVGVVTLTLATDGGPAAFLNALATGHPERFPGFQAWAAPTFEVSSGTLIELGLDGETQVMPSPLRFSIRPRPIRVRLPKHAIGYSPAARSLGWRDAARELVGVALGRPSRFQV
jgi:diacylglycerol kinase family enzyme